MRENTKIVMVVVAIAFVGWMGFEGYLEISGQSAGAQSGELGTVNGEPVPYSAYQITYQQLYEQARQQAGGQLSREQVRQVEEMAWQQMVGQVLVQRELKRRGIVVTDTEIRQAALQSPHPELMRSERFQTDGRFDLAKYQQFLASPAANEELLLQLEAYYRDQIPRSKLLRQIVAGAYVSDAELWQAWRDRTETATVEYVALPVAKLVPGDVEVTDRQIRTYYEEHPDEFTRPATARLNLAFISKAPSAADSAAALRKAQQLRAELQGGADFAEVARRESQDPGSAAQGGDLGSFGRGRMVPAFEQAAFSLAVGAVSEPVQTPFGYHLIQVQERSGDEVKARHILLPVAGTEESLDALYARADSLETLAESGGLERAGRATRASLRSGVTVSEADAFVPGVGSVLDAAEWATTEADGEEAAAVSPLFETEEAFYVAKRVSSTPAGTIPLPDATAQIRRQLVSERKKEQTRTVAQELVQQVRGGKSLQAVAAARGLEVATTGPFTRMDFNPVFGQASAPVGAAFGVPLNQVSDVVEGPLGLFVVRPIQRTDADRAAWEAQKVQQRNEATAQLQQSLLERWLQSLRSEAAIVDRRSEVLRRS